MVGAWERAVLMEMEGRGQGGAVSKAHSGVLADGLDGRIAEQVMERALFPKQERWREEGLHGKVKNSF